MGVEWVTGPGRRIELKTVPKDVSRIIGVRPGLGTHPHADQSIHRSGGSLSGRFNPRCRAGVPPFGVMPHFNDAVKVGHQNTLWSAKATFAELGSTSWWICFSEHNICAQRLTCGSTRHR